MRRNTGAAFVILAAIGPLLIINQAHAGNSTGPVDSYALASQVLNNYLDVYPICEENTVVQVYIDISLSQILGVNSPQQMIMLNIGMILQWTDCNLHWNATEYNIESIEMPSSKTLWLPDISWNQRVGAGIADALASARARVRYDGTVTMSEQLIIDSFCRQNILYFPFDTQSCDMTFSSWLHDESQLNLSNIRPIGDLSKYGSSDEWEVTNFTVRRQDTWYCCTYIADFAEVKYTLKIRRKPMFYLFNLVYPVMLISGISIVVFLLPPQGGEKVTLSITVLLSLTVYLLLIAQQMPEQSAYIPLLGQYFAAMIALVTASCGLSVYVVNLHFRAETGEKMSGWMKSVLVDRIGGVLLCSKGCGRSGDKATNDPNSQGIISSNLQSDSLMAFDTYMDDWMRLARVVDRICLILFGLTVLIITVTLAAIAYQNYYNPPAVADSAY